MRFDGVSLRKRCTATLPIHDHAATHDFAERREELSGEPRRRGIDQPPSELRDLPADLGIDFI